MRPPSVLDIREIVSKDYPRVQIMDRYFPARPEPYYSFWRRIEATWMVFTGKADALRWPFQEK